jgi:prepilin-type N-terminal cleavage/methylation domain-containing protein
MQTRTTPRQTRGFSFIEILVVMGIIAVLTSMVVVLVPGIQEQARITKSRSNVGSILTLMLGRRTARSGGWPPYNGKNFTLDVVATRQLDPRNPQNLEVLFSPADVLYRLESVDIERYQALTPAALRQGGDHANLTSYAGRRNAERAHLITPDQEKIGTMVLCDDDDGPLHHPGGLVAGYTHGGARFLEWADLDMSPPSDPDEPAPFLGDAAPVEALASLWGH